MGNTRVIDAGEVGKRAGDPGSPELHMLVRIQPSISIHLSRRERYGGAGDMEPLRHHALQTMSASCEYSRSPALSPTAVDGKEVY